MDTKEYHGVVSIIVPVYNVENYIEDSVKSLTKQIYEDIEIILVDDGSQDNSITIAEDILTNTKISWKTVRQENRGLPSARNTGLRNANGEFVCFIDPDDIISQVHINLLVKALVQQNVNFAFSSYENTRVNNRYGSEYPTEIHVRECYYTGNELKKIFLERKIQMHCSATIFKRSFLIENNLIFNEKLRFGEDVDFLWRIVTVVDGGAYIKLNTYKYLIRPGSLMTDQRKDRIIKFIEEFDVTSRNLNVSENIQSLIFARVVLGVIHSFARYSTYASFVDLRKELMKFDLKSKLKNIKTLKDFRWELMEYMFEIFPMGFYLISKKF